jgi:MFS family permease
VTGALARYLRRFTGFSRDARLFLLTTVAFGAAISLYWIDFNLYLGALGIDRTTISSLLVASQLAGVIVALPASALSDRFGRRAVMAGGMVLVALALLAFLPGQLPLLLVGVVMFGAGSQAVFVVQVPYIAEHTAPGQRNEYFSTWAAIGNLTSLVAALAGGAIATGLAARFNLDTAAAPYQILLGCVAILGGLSVATVWLLSSDRPAPDRVHPPGRGRFGFEISDRRLFVRLLLPGFLTALGAGQLIPFLNIFVQDKFGLGLAAVNAVFAITSVGTTLAILAQPALARRFGRIGSIVIVQSSSIPFLLVLGFSPVLWTVVVAMTVRNSLMNAGSPIFDAFAMGRVSAAERATLSAGMTLLWSLGWVIAPIYYGQLQLRLGFTGGYAVNFITIIALYTTATYLLWHWFRDTDRTATNEAMIRPLPVETPVPFEHA